MNTPEALAKQLEMMRELELLIAEKRINESYAHLLSEVDEELDIKHDTHEGGQ